MSLQIKFIISILLAILMSGVCHAKINKLDKDFNISGVSIAKDGYYLVDVSVFVDKKKDANIEIVRQYALLGCLYKGFVVDRFSQKPIISHSLKDQDQEYINTLIIEDYNTYTSSSYPIQIVKVGKQFRISSIILVSKDKLREKLERDGVIRKLGF